MEKNKNMFQTTNQVPIPSATAHHAHHEALHLRVIRFHMAPPAEMAVAAAVESAFMGNLGEIVKNLRKIYSIFEFDYGNLSLEIAY
jgi:hypothetical protein